MTTLKMHDMVLQHLVDMPNLNGIFCSAKERSSGKTKLLLAFKNNKKVFLRNGIKGTWEEIPNDPANNLVQDVWNKIVKERKVPAFRYEGTNIDDQAD